MKTIHSMIYLLGVVLTFWSSPIWAADEIDQRFSQANEAYSQNDFATAIRLYEEFIAERGISASVLFNLANSYAQSGNVGKAVLNYHRALRIHPNDPDINGNLQLVRNQAGLFPREQRPVEQVIQLLSLDQWTGLGGLALAALTLTLALGFRGVLAKRSQLIVSLLALAILILSAICAVARSNEWRAGVVVANGVRLQISPFAGAASVGEIQAGRLVYPQKPYGQYHYVTDETGRQGWLRNDALLSIVDISAAD